VETLALVPQIQTSSFMKKFGGFFGQQYRFHAEQMVNGELLIENCE
jgi:hypothetical protein